MKKSLEAAEQRQLQLAEAGGLLHLVQLEASRTALRVQGDRLLQLELQLVEERRLLPRAATPLRLGCSLAEAVGVAGRLMLALQMSGGAGGVEGSFLWPLV